MNTLPMPSTIVGGSSFSSDTSRGAGYSAVGAKQLSPARKRWVKNGAQRLPFAVRLPRTFRFFKYWLPLAVLLAFGFSVPAFAQTADQTQPTVEKQSAAPLYPPNNEFGIWGGYSVGNSHVFGTTSDRQLGDSSLPLRKNYLRQVLRLRCSTRSTSCPSKSCGNSNISPVRRPQVSTATAPTAAKLFTAAASILWA